MELFPKDLKKRVTEDHIDIEGRTFKLTMFDPLLGNYILLKLFTMVLPFGISDALKAGLTGEGTEQIPTDTTNYQQMDKKEFLELQRDVLSFVYEELPAGPTPVVRSNGTYGIMNFTMTIALQLLIAEIAFNFNDFFEESQ